MFSFPIMKLSLCFTDVKIIATPATSFVNNFRLLRTIQVVLVRKESYNAASYNAASRGANSVAMISERELGTYINYLTF